MSRELRLRDRWMWDWQLLRWCVLVPLVVGIVLPIALFPRFGSHALWFMLLGLIGPLNGAIYSAVGTRVRALEQTARTSGGEVAESLIVIGKTQAPGVAVLRERELDLVPIVGEPRTIPLDEIETVRHESFFNGKTLIWKRWLVLGVKPRLGFALPEATARRWYARLAG